MEIPKIDKRTLSGGVRISSSHRIHQDQLDQGGAIVHHSTVGLVRPPILAWDADGNSLPVVPAPRQKEVSDAELSIEAVAPELREMKDGSRVVPSPAQPPQSIPTVTAHAAPAPPPVIPVTAAPAALPQTNLPPITKVSLRFPFGRFAVPCHCTIVDEEFRMITFVMPLDTDLSLDPGCPIEFSLEGKTYYAKNYGLFTRIPLFNISVAQFGYSLTPPKDETKNNSTPPAETV